MEMYECLKYDEIELATDLLWDTVRLFEARTGVYDWLMIRRQENIYVRCNDQSI
jgi:hypothetical protein